MQPGGGGTTRSPRNALTYVQSCLVPCPEVHAALAFRHGDPLLWSGRAVTESNPSLHFGGSFSLLRKQVRPAVVSPDA